MFSGETNETLLAYKTSASKYLEVTIHLICFRIKRKVSEIHEEDMSFDLEGITETAENDLEIKELTEITQSDIEKHFDDDSV